MDPIGHLVVPQGPQRKRTGLFRQCKHAFPGFGVLLFSDAHVQARICAVGSRCGAIIPIELILCSVHLFPVTPQHWDTFSVLDHCHTFFTNPFSHRHNSCLRDNLALLYCYLTSSRLLCEHMEDTAGIPMCTDGLSHLFDVPKKLPGANALTSR